MKLVGLPLSFPNLYGIAACITAPFFNKPKGIVFLVDTGASCTTISYADGLDYEIIMKVKYETSLETNVASVASLFRKSF
ncbi:MAG: hypothetical protein WBZ36_13465 [Candidatus Nitrosopolaris sp.]